MKLLSNRVNLRPRQTQFTTTFAIVDMNMPGKPIASETMKLLLVASAQQSRITRSISYCILTLILLETTFTFDKEIIYIWRRPWSLFKILFIPCRYFSLVPALLVIIPPAPSHTYCEFFDWYIGVYVRIVTIVSRYCYLIYCYLITCVPS